MCNLVKHIKRPYFDGWKIVAMHKKTGKYYSVAMGFCYDDYPDKVPIPEKQKKIVNIFNDGLLDPSKFTGFARDMIGRTAVFCEYHDAGVCHAELINYVMHYPVTFKFELIITKVRVSKDLMTGYYGDFKVVAGRKIKFLN